VKSGVVFPRGSSLTNWVTITPGTLDLFLISTWIIKSYDLLKTLYVLYLFISHPYTKHANVIQNWTARYTAFTVNYSFNHMRAMLPFKVWTKKNKGVQISDARVNVSASWPHYLKVNAHASISLQTVVIIADMAGSWTNRSFEPVLFSEPVQKTF